MGQGIPLLYVGFVAEDNCLDLIVRVVLHFKEPFVEIFEGVTLGQVENEEGGNGALVVRSGDGLKGFLAGLNNNTVYCIPNLYLDCEIIDSDVLRPELHSKCRLMISLEPLFGKSKQEAGFPHTLVV